MKAKKWNISKAFLKSNKNEQFITIKPSNEVIKRCKEKHISYEPLKLRLIRIDIENGEDYVLITNLTYKQSYRFKELAELYKLRWPTEKSFKHLKLRGELENLSGKSTLFL